MCRACEKTFVFIKRRSGPFRHGYVTPSRGMVAEQRHIVAERVPWHQVRLCVAKVILRESRLSLAIAAAMSSRKRRDFGLEEVFRYGF